MVCADDPGAAALAERSAALGVRVLRYGSGPGAELAGALVDWEQHGTGAVAHIQLAGEPHPRVMRLAVPGRHMALNALAALLAALEAGAPIDDVIDGLAGFEGVRRRFELVGTAGGVRVFDDYAHHPTEVRAALTALRAIARQDRTGHPTIAGARSIVVFQPHLYSRTKTFAREFGNALDTADVVFVLDVYAAREQPMAGISGATVAEHVSVPVHYVADFSAVAARVAAVAGDGRRGGHDGRRRRDDAGRRDHRGPAGQGRARRGDPMTTPGQGTNPEPVEDVEDAAADRQNRRPAHARTCRTSNPARRVSRPTPRRRPTRRRRPRNRTSRAHAGAPAGNARSAAPPRLAR